MQWRMTVIMFIYTCVLDIISGMLKVIFINNNYVTLHVGNRAGYLSNIIQAKIVAQGKWYGLLIEPHKNLHCSS